MKIILKFFWLFQIDFEMVKISLSKGNFEVTDFHGKYLIDIILGEDYNRVYNQTTKNYKKSKTQDYDKGHNRSHIDLFVSNFL